MLTKMKPSAFWLVTDRSSVIARSHPARLHGYRPNAAQFSLEQLPERERPDPVRTLARIKKYIAIAWIDDHRRLQSQRIPVGVHLVQVFQPGSPDGLVLGFCLSRPPFVNAEAKLGIEHQPGAVAHHPGEIRAHGGGIRIQTATSQG